jgi:TolA-binding protein
MKKLFLIFSLSVILFSEEVSIFGAGDLDSPDPYGLTQSEKKILENQSSIKKLSVKNKQTKTKIKSLEDNINALQELLKGVSKQAHQQKKKIDNLINDLEQNHLITEINYKKIQEDMSKTQSQVEKQKLETKKTLNQKIEESFKKVNGALEKQDKTLTKIKKGFDKDFRQIQKKIKQIGIKLTKIDKQYVTQKQLDFVVEDFNRFKETVIGEFENLAKKDDSYFDFSKHTNQEIFRKGKKYIQLGKYKDAIKFFSYLITKHYRPATDNFYIGEANYFLGRYETAIKHFKESVAIYDKSKFMPTLLLHSGISLEKMHDIEQAKSFYQVLVSTYKNLPEGKKAEKLLKNLK